MDSLHWCVWKGLCMCMYMHVNFQSSPYSPQYYLYKFRKKKFFRMPLTIYYSLGVVEKEQQNSLLINTERHSLSSLQFWVKKIWQHLGNLHDDLLTELFYAYCISFMGFCATPSTYTLF